MNYTILCISKYTVVEGFYVMDFNLIHNTY